MSELRNKEIEIQVIAHRESTLLMGYSDDLKGLLVPARSLSELQERLPAAIRELLEAQGFEVVSVEAVHKDHLPDSFVPGKLTANARLIAA
ncbi:DUF1902 domain-containing protein [Ferrovibrio sp.]|uniref:DUF1902 domain-containing protein n=1 Tax=Ferrovibrio sp. TaxID=1917215 RepID=UPI00311E544A